MTDTYTITFAGRTTGEYELAQVKHSLAALFKMNATQVEALFSGKPVVIKRHIDKTTAQKYYAAFKKAGAVCVISSDNTSAAQANRSASSPIRACRNNIRTAGPSLWQRRSGLTVAG